MYRYFPYFAIICPLENGVAPWIPFTQLCFVPSLVEIGPRHFEKKMKMCQVYEHMNNGQKLSWARITGLFL